MYKKIMTFVMAALLCFMLMGTVNVKAAGTDTLEVTADSQPSREEIQKKNEELFQKWSALSQKQKNDIYKSVKGTIDAQAKFLDKLVKYDLMQEDEATMIKDEMYAKFNELKDNDALFQGPAAPKDNAAAQESVK